MLPDFPKKLTNFGKWCNILSIKFLLGEIFVYTFLIVSLFVLFIFLISLLISFLIDRKYKRKNNEQTKKVNEYEQDAKKINYVEYDSTYTKIAGVTFGNIQSILPKLRSGMSLRFIREPKNPYDRNAIRIECNWQKIGYLSADLARDYASILDHGGKIIGSIANITGGRGKTYGCNIEIIVYRQATVFDSIKTPPLGTSFSDIKCQSEHIDESNPLFGKICAILNCGYEKIPVAQAVVNLGGEIRASVSSKTDIVITGNPNIMDSESKSAIKLKEIIASDKNVKIISIEEFKGILEEYL